ncbi:MAG: hypothetical protein H0X71_04380 [Rubrobacter sp.]|nr:hypothetical protein [Rubrobacter sp.]
MTTVAAWLLTLCGLVLVGIGGYFVLARPALLPEDARFMGAAPAALLKAAPGLSRWLKHVFWVMGGYIASTGVLVTYLANTGLRSGEDGALAVLALVWTTSIGWMALVNVLIDSDFKRPLLALAALWGLALVLAVVGR